MMDNPPVQPNVKPDTGKRPLTDPNANGSVVMKIGAPPPLVAPNIGGNTKMIDKAQPKPDQDDHADDGGTIDKITPPTLSSHVADPIGSPPQSHAALPNHGQGPQPNADSKPQIMPVTPLQGVASNVTPTLGGTVMKDTSPATMPAATPDMAALATHIAAKVKDGDKQFDIRLDPPDFGRVDVRLSVSSDGKAQAHVTADKQQTLDLLQRDQSTLHRALKETGLDLSSNSLNFSLKGQANGDGGAGAYQQQRAQTTPAIDDPAEPAIPQPVYASPTSDARLDIRI
jgi:flagellar hook-length control protein FliK